jgi:hypothetical protein
MCSAYKKSENSEIRNANNRRMFGKRTCFAQHHTVVNQAGNGSRQFQRAIEQEPLQPAAMHGIPTVQHL